MTDPLWVAVDEQSHPSLADDLNVDVAVVGAGFSGLGAAYAALQLGATVTVLEFRTVASGASGRNAGFVLAGPAMGFKTALETIGLEQTLAIWRLTDENHRLLVRLIEELDVDCGYLRRGSLSLAADEEEWLELRDDSRLMREAGIEIALVERQSLPRPFDGKYVGGVYHAGNAELDPGAFLRGLAGHLAGSVSIFERTPVERVTFANGVELRCAGGSVQADRVVLATNAYTTSLLPAVPIAPTRGQVAATSPIERVVVPFPMYADRGYQYWRQTADGRVVVGGWRNLAVPDEVGTDEALNPRIQSAIDEFIGAVARETAVERRWAGIMGFAPDHFPLVGNVPGRDSLVIAAGYSGHGVAMAFRCGMLAAQQALGASPSIPFPFDPGRFGASL